MAGDSSFALYLSHSWRPRDVDLNVSVWQALCNDCELLVDAPEAPGAAPPYYINRIEELLRRSDLFVSVLTHRKPNEGDFPAGGPRLECSAYSYFEIRLAERLDMPRLVLYERTTGFRPPATQRPWEVYVAFDRGAQDNLPEQGRWRRVVEPAIRRWQEWTAAYRKAGSYDPSTQAAILVDRSKHAALADALEGCLREGGYEPRFCDLERRTSGDALRQLREAGLVVAELSSSSRRLNEVYAAAHALGTPSIRLLSDGDGAALPWLLDGEPGGYQNDIVRWSSPEQVPPLVEPRIKAMFRLSPALKGEEAADYLQSKRYAQFFVFLSYTEKTTPPGLVTKIHSKLAQRHVTPFAFNEENATGDDWREKLDKALRSTTHFVALLSEGYEVSRVCTEEIENVLARGNVAILPFRAGGRAAPHPKLGHLHHTLLDDPDQERNAEKVVEQIMDKLEESVRAAQPA